MSAAMVRSWPLAEGRSIQPQKRRGLNYQQLVTLDVLGVFTVVGLKIGLFNYITSWLIVSHINSVFFVQIIFPRWRQSGPSSSTLFTWPTRMRQNWLMIGSSAASFNTHTHPFNGPLSRTNRVGRYQTGKTNLDFTEARGSEWQWHQLGHMQVCTSLQTDNHARTPPLTFLQAGCPSCRPTNSIKALKAVSFE